MTRGNEGCLRAQSRPAILEAMMLVSHGKNANHRGRFVCGVFVGAFFVQQSSTFNRAVGVFESIMESRAPGGPSLSSKHVTQVDQTTYCDELDMRQEFYLIGPD
jgi:hypothetical protein